MKQLLPKNNAQQQDLVCIIQPVQHLERTQASLPEGAAERSESKIPMLAGGKHTATNRWIRR